jgi:pimeloyl-ACP methyl ester carboxylesterase
MPALLLLHGWTASADIQWFAAYETLAERYPFVAIDHRGHGRGLRTIVPFTLEDAADDAAALVRELDVGPVIVVGYSMGGPIGLLLARRHPELVSGMVLAATALEWRSRLVDRMQWWSLALLEPLLRSRLAKLGGRRYLRYLVRHDATLEPYLPWIVAETRRNDPTDITDAGYALARYDARPWAASIDVPTAVVLTTKDRMVSPGRQRALAKATRAQTFTIAGGHMCFLDQRKQFGDATRQAVDAVVTRLSRD